MRTLLFFLWIALFGCPLFVSAQTALHFFSDTIATGNHNRAMVTAHEKEFIYVGGQSFDGDGFTYTPSIVKLDTLGNTIWSYSLNKEVDVQTNAGTSYRNTYIQRLEVDATGVYAQLYGQNELWKLDKTTGNLLWKRAINEPKFVLSANANEMVVAYNANGNYNYDLISKATGQLISTQVLGVEINWNETASMAFGPDGAAYIGRNDMITRYTSASLTTLSWSVQAIASGVVTSIMPNEDGSVYIAGVRVGTSLTQIVLGRMNATDGSSIWQARPGISYFYESEVVNSVKIDGNYIYANAIHQLYGSVYTGHHLWKFNRTTGAFVWERTYHPTTGTALSPIGQPYAAALSLDVDANGSVYSTGYEGANDSRLGQWGIVKFTADGNFVYHKTIFTGAPYASQYSRGVMAYFYNNRVFYLGELQQSSAVTSTNLYLLATDTGSVFAPYRTKKTEATYQEPSAVKRILPFSDSKYAVYSQFGQGIRITLKSSATGSTLWEKTIRRGAHLSADQMAITADNKILISFKRHSSSGMRFDYANQMDSVIFMKFDSTGAIIFETKHLASSFVNFVSIQLYPSGDTNNVYVYSMRDYRNYDNAIHFFNIDKSPQPLGSGYNLISSQYLPLQGRQTLLVPKSRDTSVHLQYYFPSSTAALYIPYKFDQAYTGGWKQVEWKLIGQDMIVQNMAKFDATSVAFSGRNKTGVDYKIGRYQFGQTAVQWIVSRPAGETVEGVSTSYNSVYWNGKSGGSLLISRLNAATGATQWEKTITSASPNQYYIPLDQAYNPIRHQYTICGFIEDRSIITNAQQAFYITVDTLGNIVSQWSQAGDYSKNNQLNTIAISQYGQTLVGGALYKVPYGRSAVLIEADTIIVADVKPQTPVITVTPSLNICQGDTAILTAASTDCHHCTYQWNDAGNTIGQQLKVSSLPYTYQVTVSNSAGSASATQEITVKPAPVKPIITLQQDSLKSSAVAGNQWFVDGSMIPNAKGQYVRPAISGNYKVQVTLNGCSSLLSDAFNYTLTAIIDPAVFDGQVEVVPNPMLNKLITTNHMSYPLELQLYDAMGKTQITTRIPANSTKEIFVSQLKSGVYMLLITDTKTKKSISKTLLKQ